MHTWIKDLGPGPCRYPHLEPCSPSSQGLATVSQPQPLGTCHLCSGCGWFSQAPCPPVTTALGVWALRAPPHSISALCPAATLSCLPPTAGPHSLRLEASGGWSLFSRLFHSVLCRARSRAQAAMGAWKAVGSQPGSQVGPGGSPSHLLGDRTPGTRCLTSEVHAWSLAWGLPGLTQRLRGP